jgi:hypothetical protein
VSSMVQDRGHRTAARCDEGAGRHGGTPWYLPTLSRTAIDFGSVPRGHIVIMMMRRRCVWPNRFLIWGRVWVLVEICGSDREILSAGTSESSGALRLSILLGVPIHFPLVNVF